MSEKLVLRDLIEGAEKAVRECEHYGQQDYKRIHEYYLRELRTLRDTMVTNRAPVSPNENWLCYECVAAIVNSGGRPLIELWGANQTPHKEGQCGKCGKAVVTLVMYPKRY